MDTTTRPSPPMTEDDDILQEAMKPLSARHEEQQAASNDAKFPPAQCVQDLFHYDAAKGIVTWKAGRNAGKPLGGKSRNSSGYLQAQFTIGGKCYRPLVHVVAWALATGEWPTEQIDHINHQRDDNRLVNLRPVTHAENMRNRSRHRNNTSGMMGVHWDKRSGRWIVQMRWEGTRYHLGSFATKEEAEDCRRIQNVAHGLHPNHGLDLAAGEKPAMVITTESDHPSTMLPALPHQETSDGIA